MNIESIKRIGLPRIKSQHLVTGLAGVFALVSVQNIAHFFIGLHHPFLASWTLGIAIGTALVILAHLLSEIDMRERKAFFGLLTVTLILVFLSGIIQGVTYSKELGAVGYVLAFVLAATGEIVLPLAHSWHHEAKRRQAVNDAGQRVEEIAAETMVTVMAGADTAKAKKLAEKQIEILIAANLEAIVKKLMPKVASSSKLQRHVDDAVVNEKPMKKARKLAKEFGPHNLADANAAQLNNQRARGAALRVILEKHGKMSRGQIMPLLKDAGFNVTGDTVSHDLRRINAVRHGRYWSAPEPIDVPVNGVGKACVNGVG